MIRCISDIFNLLHDFICLLQVSLQDSRTRAQIELPDLTTQAIIKLYRQHAPDKLKLLEPMLRGQGLLGDS